jgi:hypothetical protein
MLHEEWERPMSHEQRASIETRREFHQNWMTSLLAFLLTSLYQTKALEEYEQSVKDAGVSLARNWKYAPLDPQDDDTLREQTCSVLRGQDAVMQLVLDDGSGVVGGIIYASWSYSISLHLRHAFLYQFLDLLRRLQLAKGRIPEVYSICEY